VVVVVGGWVGGKEKEEGIWFLLECLKFLHSTVKCVFVMNTPPNSDVNIIGWIHQFPHQLWFGRSYVYSAPLQGNGQSNLMQTPFLHLYSHKEQPTIR
jgi:hypothetical protein